MRAALDFVTALKKQNLLSSVTSVNCSLYGSLGSTGIGHGTPGAVIAGLTGLAPETCMPEQVRTQLLERWRRERGLSDEYQPLLKLLIDRKQILLLPVVIQKIMELWAAHARVLVIMVESVDILTPIELNNIQQACEIHTGYRVLMRTMHNSTLIAGFRVRAATLWYDASVSGRLTRMAKMVQYGN